MYLASPSSRVLLLLPLIGVLFSAPALAFRANIGFWSSGEGPCATTDSFEDWTGGIPTGWTRLFSGTGSIAESTTTGVTDGAKAVRISGSSQALERTVFVGSCKTLKIDYYTVIDQQTLASFYINGNLVTSLDSGSGTRVIDLSTYSGTVVFRIHNTVQDYTGSGFIFDNLRIEP